MTDTTESKGAEDRGGVAGRRVLSAGSIREKEVDWYKRKGRYKKRITTDANNNKYVIGDWSWNKGNRPREFIEQQMEVDISSGR